MLTEKVITLDYLTRSSVKIFHLFSGLKHFLKNCNGGDTILDTQIFKKMNRVVPKETLKALMTSAVYAPLKKRTLRALSVFLQ